MLTEQTSVSTPSVPWGQMDWLQMEKFSWVLKNNTTSR